MANEPSRVPSPPPAMDAHQESLEARIRWKMQRGTRLNREEAEFLAHLYGDHAIDARDIGP